MLKYRFIIILSILFFLIGCKKKEFDSMKYAEEYARKMGYYDGNDFEKDFLDTTPIKDYISKVEDYIETFSFPIPKVWAFQEKHLIQAANDLDVNISNIRELIDLATKYNEDEWIDAITADVNSIASDMIDMTEIFDDITEIEMKCIHPNIMQSNAQSSVYFPDGGHELMCPDCGEYVYIKEEKEKFIQELQ